MGLSSWFADKQGEKRNRFSFSDGRIMSPSEFGEMIGDVGIQTGNQLIEALFMAPQAKGLHSIGSRIKADPMPARLHVYSLLIGAAFVYPMKVLKVPEAPMHQVMQGMNKRMLTLKKPDGKFINPADVQQINEMVSAFYDFAVNEVSAMPETVKKSTQLLMHLILSAYNGGGAKGAAAIADFEKSASTDPNVFPLLRTLNEVPMAPLKTFADLGVKYGS